MHDIFCAKVSRRPANRPDFFDFDIFLSHGFVRFVCVAPPGEEIIPRAHREDRQIRHVVARRADRQHRNAAGQRENAPKRQHPHPCAAPKRRNDIQREQRKYRHIDQLGEDHHRVAEGKAALAPPQQHIPERQQIRQVVRLRAAAQIRRAAIRIRREEIEQLARNQLHKARNVAHDPVNGLTLVKRIAHLIGHAPLVLADVADLALAENRVVVAAVGVVVVAHQHVHAHGLRLIDEVAGEAFNIAYGGREYLIDIYYNLTKALGKDIEPKFGPERNGDIKHSNADISKAQRLLGYAPDYSFAQGLMEAIDWYKKNL